MPGARLTGVAAASLTDPVRLCIAFLAMGKKSREKRERRNVRGAPRPVREGELIPGVSVHRKGEQVVLRKKMNDDQHAAFVAQLRDRVIAAPAELKAMRDQLVDIIARVPTAEFLVRMAYRFMPHNPETYRESESLGVAIQVEYPTWLALQLPAPRSGGGPMEYATFAEAEKLLERMWSLTRCGCSSRVQ